MNRRTFLKTLAAGAAACIITVKAHARKPFQFRLIRPQLGRWTDMGMLDMKDSGGFTITRDEGFRIPMYVAAARTTHVVSPKTRVYLPQINGGKDEV